MKEVTMMINFSKKQEGKLLIICLVLFNFLLFLILFKYIEGKMKMNQDILNSLVYPILVAVVASIITSIMINMIFKIFSKKEKWRRLSNQIDKKYPGYKDINQYYKKVNNRNILDTEDGQIPVIDLFYISYQYMATIRRFGAVDEIDEVYNFMYKFLKSALIRINKLTNQNIIIQSGGESEFTDVLISIKLSEMFGQKIDKKKHVENYRQYLLDLTFFEVKDNFYDSLVIYNKNGERIEFLKLNNKEFKALIRYFNI